MPAVKFNGSEHGRGSTQLFSGQEEAPALAYHDGERVRFAVAIEGENNIRAGVRYRLNEQHQFVEC
ncbi:putative oxidoreductase subunit [Escherichia coli]|uniref:Putative oxidoreductase subunit n=1 Tax=Escherichia coli TaxID=562 RepID=A0A2X1NC65_ECOLX|nr:putative oxidoreductase subunit [Escherichia coli]